MHGIIYLPTHVNIPYMDPIGYSIDCGIDVTLPIFFGRKKIIKSRCKVPRCKLT